MLTLHIYCEFNWEQITELESVIEKEREEMKVGRATDLRESEIGNEDKTACFIAREQQKEEERQRRGRLQDMRGVSVVSALATRVFLCAWAVSK